MADFDWKVAVKGVAPVIGGLLATVGGPAGALAGAALTAAANALGVPDTPDAVAAAMQAGLSPEQKAALIAADLDYKKAVLDAGFKDKQLAAEVEKSYLADIDAARKAHAQVQGILWLGYGINALSYICVFTVLYGCFYLLGGVKLGIDPGIAAMLGSIVGGTVQWLMSNAAQANAFFFGSSPSSRQVATDLAKAVGTGVEGVSKR